MIIYLAEVSICWMLFYGIYVLLLSKETFFSINRWYLLSTLILGLIIPVFTVDIMTLFFQEPASGVVYLSESFSGFEYVVESEVAAAQKANFSWLTLLKIIYSLGFMLVLFRFSKGLYQIYQLYQGGKIVQKRNYQLVLTQTPHLPFSFFNYLFWHHSTKLEDPDSGKIITHEMAHINQWHSLDVLFLELLGLFLWFSPPIYWYKKSLRAVHEYLADAYVLQNTKKKQYGQLLIRQVQSGMQIALANHFIHSQLKQRINMMTRKESQRKALMRYLPALPLLLLMILVFSNKNVQQNFKDTTVKASLAFDEILDGDFNPQKVKEAMRIAYQDGSKGWFTEEGEEMNWDAHKLKELHRTCKKYIKKYPENEADIRLLMMEVAAENGYQISFEGESLRYKEIEGFKEGTEVKMQVSPDNLSTEEIYSSRSTDEMTIYKKVDEMPRFPGCEDKESDAKEAKKCADNKMLTFIYTKIAYPKTAREQGIEGTVVARFVVNKNGEISKAEIVRSIGGGTGEEVLSVIGKMPNWIPGKKDGEAVNVEFFLPVKFMMEKDHEKETTENSLLELGEGTKPLYIVDGEEYTGNFEDISPNTIATMDVLKGEAAMKEFGEKGKNGVVRIQLKKESQTKSKTIIAEHLHTENGEPVFKVVDKMPRFPGCDNQENDYKAAKKCADNKMLNFIYTNIQYPKAARDQGIEGTVVIRFWVEKDGTVSNAEILRNPGGGTGEESLRVVNLMTEQDIKWIPGEHKGKSVNVVFNLPVKFKLADEDTDCCKEDKNEDITDNNTPNSIINQTDEPISFQLNKNTIKLNAFPNPARENLTITMEGQAKDIILTVFDVSGKQYLMEKIDAFDGLYSKTLNLENVAKGTLIINVNHKNLDYQKKVIVQ